MDHQKEQPYKLANPIAIILGSFVIAGAIWLSNGKTAPAAPTTAAPQAGQPFQAPFAVDSSKVITANEPFVGSPSAPLTIAYWYDYQCPICQRDEEMVIPQLMKDYVNTGKAKIVFKDYQFLGADSQTLGRISRAVWDIAPGKFYAWHKAIFDNQGQENTGWATNSKILSITTGVLGAADAARAMDLAVQKFALYQKAMDADKAEGTALGVSGTPDMIIGKVLVSGLDPSAPYTRTKSAVDEALAGK
jgi:protein-disulfide isomerase